MLSPLLIAIILPTISLAFNPIQGGISAAPYRIRNLCPSSTSCSCTLNDLNKLSARCYRNMKEFPSSLPANLSSLTIQCKATVDGQNRPTPDGSWFSTIPATAFRSMPLLEEISISRCPIMKFPSLLFANLPRLKIVSFDSLLIRSMREDLFQNSTSLEQFQLLKIADLEHVAPLLLLKQKRLTTVRIIQTKLNGDIIQQFLNPIKRSLVEFTLSSSLIPLSLPARTFQGFRSLLTITLRHDQLTDVKFLQYATKVRKLSLGKNPGLATTPPLDFSRYKNLKSLVSLDIRFSNLREIPDNSLRHMKNLQKLYLGDNQLNAVPSDIYKHLNQKLLDVDLVSNRIQVFPEEMKPLFSNSAVNINIDGNPIHCNCEAKWLTQFKARLGLLTCESAPETPYRVVKKLLSSIPANQLVCIEPSKPKIIPTNAVVQVDRGLNSRAIMGSKSGAKIIPYEDGSHTITISRGQKIDVRCSSSGDPAPHLTWIYPWKSQLNREATKERTLFSNEISANIAYDRLKYIPIANLTCIAQNLKAKRSNYILLKNLNLMASTTSPGGGNMVNSKVTPQPSKGNGVGLTSSLHPSISLLFLFGPLLMLHRAFDFS